MLFISAFVISFVIVLIKKVPFVIKIVFSLSAITISIAATAFYILLGGGVEFRILDVDKESVVFYDMDENDFGFYTDFEAFSYAEHSLFFKQANTYILKYDKNDFDAAKKVLFEKNKFYDITGVYGEAGPEFRCGDFDFYVRHSEEKVFPKVIYFIGFNESDYEIAHVTFNDLNLDSVSSFQNVLLYYCGWQYVEKSRSNQIFKFCYSD